MPWPERGAEGLLRAAARSGCMDSGGSGSVIVALFLHTKFTLVARQSSSHTPTVPCVHGTMHRSPGGEHVPTVPWPQEQAALWARDQSSLPLVLPLFIHTGAVATIH